MISFALTVARKDLLLTFTRGSGLVQGLLLGLLLLFVFSLSQGVGERMSPQGAGAVFWLGSAFCQVLIFNTLYALEEANGARLGLLLAPAPIQAVWLGKALAVCQWLIFFYAPVEAQLGLMQKVFYTHLPLAWWALISFLVVFVASVVYLIRRSPAADRVCAAAAEVGVLLAGLALVTGMIWARRSWGVWWTWDPRLTTTLVMWFIYAGYLVLRGLDLPPQRKRMICAVVGVVAFLDVPLVFLSARLWRSIHPAVFASKGGGLEPEMKLTAIACVAAMGLFWAGLVWLRTRQLGLRDRLDSLRLQAED